MTLAEYNEICGRLPGAHMDVLWGADHVWKVGGRMFSAASQQSPAKYATISFKVSDGSFDIVSRAPGLRPAPYAARHKWVQTTDGRKLGKRDIAAYIAASHALVAARLPKKTRRELGLVLRDAP